MILMIMKKITTKRYVMEIICNNDIIYQYEYNTEYLQ